MANIKENTTNPVWPEGIYQLETSDPVLGGENGVDNRQAAQLAARTQVLKKQIADNKAGADGQIATKADKTTVITAGNGLTGGGDLTAPRTVALGTPGTLSGTSTNTVTADSHTHALTAATATVAGVTKIIDHLNSTDATAALSAAQGKSLQDGKADKATTISGYGITDGVTQAQLTAAINNVIAGAPGALDTLKELSAALGNDANFAATITNQLAQKANREELLNYITPQVTDDPNTTAKPFGLFKHANCPEVDLYFYINTWFYNSVDTSKYQFAVEYVTTAVGATRVYIRSKYALTTWTPWTRIDAGAVAQELVPVGSVVFFAGNTPPAGWLRANGTELSRSIYKNLFNAISTRYGAGNGSTTFRIPNLSGVFPRFWDEIGSIDPGRALGSIQQDEIRSHRHQLIDYNAIGQDYNYQAHGEGAGGSATGYYSYTQATGGNETRPINIALLGCIKY